MTVKDYYAVETGEHFALSDVDPEDRQYYQDRVEDDTIWRRESAHLEGLVEAEGKALIAAKTYRHVRIVKVSQEVVQVIE